MKKWLESNKIFFETIVMIVISFIGFYLTFCANNIMTKQTAIEEALSKPIINIETVFDEDKQTINTLNIYNNGAITSDIEIEILPYYFTVVDKINDDNSFESPIFFIPIDNQMPPIFDIKKHNTKEGLIYTISKNETLNAHIQDMNDFKKYTTNDISTNLRLRYLSLEYFIKIRYTDIFNNETINIYQCIPCINYYYLDFIYFSRDANVTTLTYNSKTYNLYEQMYNNDIYEEDEFITYIRYGETLKNRYDNFTSVVTKAYKLKKFELY